MWLIEKKKKRGKTCDHKWVSASINQVENILRMRLYGMEKFILHFLPITHYSSYEILRLIFPHEIDYFSSGA